MSDKYVREGVVDLGDGGDALEAAETLAKSVNADDVRVVESVTEGECYVEGVYDGDSVSEGWLQIGRISPAYGEPHESAKKVSGALTADDIRVVLDHTSGGYYIERHVSDE